jgi:sporulation protein YlmC with PRC-barrel domain
VAIDERGYGEHLRRMSELAGYTVEKGDPDPRGWTVIERAGRRVGRVADLLVDTDAMKVRQLLVDRSDLGEGDRDGSMFALDADEVDVNSETHEVVARRYSAESFDRAAGGARASAPGGYGTPTAEEDLEREASDVRRDSDWLSDERPRRRR